MVRINSIAIVSIGLLFLSSPTLAKKSIENIRSDYFDSNKKHKNATIYGSVVSKDNKQAISFASVYIKGTSKGVLTDENGNFSIEVPKGEHQLVVSIIGYETHLMDIKINNDEAHNLKIELNNSTYEIDEVVVVGASKGQITKEKGYSVGLVNTKDIKLQTIESVDLLDRASGITMRQDGGVGSSTQFNINGLSGNSVRIFIDGIPMRDYGSSFSLSSIPPSMIERIEIYKGVVPAALSEDALGGAVNVILKQGLKNNLATSYSYGSFNTHKWDLTGDYSNKKGVTIGGSAFFNYSDNNYKVWGDDIRITDENYEMKKITAKRFHDAYASGGVNITAGIKNKKWADELLVGALYSKMKKEIQHGASPKIVYGNRHSKQETKMVNLRYSKTNILKNVDISVFTSYSHGNRQVIDTIPYMYNWLGEIETITEIHDGQPVTVLRKWGNGEGGEASERKTDAMNIENNISGRYNVIYRLLPNHSISANMLYNRFSRDIKDSYMPEMEQKLTETRYLTKNIYSFAYENRLFKDKLRSSIFYKLYHQKVKLADPVYDKDSETFKVNHIEKSLSDQGFGGAVSYEVFPALRISLSAEKAIRLPESSELLGNTTENIETAYDLRSEKSANINFGLFGEITLDKIHFFNYDVNLFYRNVTDMIHRAVLSPDDATYAYENIGKIKSKGIDIDLKYIYNQQLFINTSFSYLDARFNQRYDKMGIEYIQYRNRLRNMPYLTSNVNVMWQKKNLFQKDALLSINYNLGYVHEFFLNWESLGSTGKAIIPMQLVHDAGIVYMFPKRKISLAFDIKNIFDKQVFDNWALQKPGRAFFAKLTYQIM